MDIASPLTHFQIFSVRRAKHYSRSTPSKNTVVNFSPDMSRNCSLFASVEFFQRLSIRFDLYQVIITYFAQKHKP
jgi:hypothetical protein